MEGLRGLWRWRDFDLIERRGRVMVGVKWEGGFLDAGWEGIKIRR